MRASVRKSICTENCVLEHEPLSKDVGVRKCPQMALNYCVGSTSSAENNVIEVKIIVSKTWNKNYSFNTKIPKQLEILSFLLTLKAKVQTSILLIHFLLLDNGVIDTDWPLIIIIRAQFNLKLIIASTVHCCLHPRNRKAAFIKLTQLQRNSFSIYDLLARFTSRRKNYAQKWNFFLSPLCKDRQTPR